jgi:molybdopterin-synthase adenylyltransferase
MEDITALIKKTAGKPAGEEYSVISLHSVKDLAAKSGLSQLQIEKSALQIGIIPRRYERNIGTLGIEGQIKLLDSCIGICGLGGLGGHLVELLARYGAGHLIIADGDVFGENNLNRQVLCTEADLGRPKTQVAASRIASINSSIEITTHQLLIEPDDTALVFSQAHLVIDALDTVSCRLDLEEGCRRLGIPLVHGAIAGNCGQVMTVFPGDPGLKCIYVEGADKGVETSEGNPPTTPALVAALQVQEAVKIVCGGELLRNGFLLLDTATNLYQFISISGPSPE